MPASAFLHSPAVGRESIRPFKDGTRAEAVQKSLTVRYCGRALLDLLAFAAAMVIGVSARGVLKRRKLEDVIDAMTGHRWLPGDLDYGVARCASGRASRYLALGRGAENTCLVRALILGVLVGDRPDVRLQIGFRPPADSTATVLGHAWVTVGGVDISEASLATPDLGFTSIQQIVITRSR